SHRWRDGRSVYLCRLVWDVANRSSPEKVYVPTYRKQRDGWHPFGRGELRRTGLLCFCQGLQQGFVDLEGYAGVAVGDLGDLVLRGDADELGDLGWGEFVVVGEPLGHVAGGVAEGVVEGAGVAEGDDGLWGFDADGGEAFAGDEVDGELDVHGGLEGVAVDFAVA